MHYFVLSSFAIILTRKRELAALLLLSFGCLVTVNVLYLFLMVPWVGLQYVIVVFPDHTHLLLETNQNPKFQNPSLTLYIIKLYDRSRQQRHLMT